VEGKFEISEWDTVTPYTVVGFNFGQFKSKSAPEGAVEVAAYVNREQNDTLRGLAAAIDQNPQAAAAEGVTSGGLTTTGMLDSALTEARNSVRVFTHYFGPLPFPVLSATQQPAGFYGQSWPTLLFLPFTALLDDTTKNQLGLSRNRGGRQFFEQVGPHEVAHQWWGHLVSPKSYRDEWLSEGFAEYSAGIFVQVVKGEKNFRNYLDFLKEEITAPLPDSTTKATDAGPISLGRRLQSEKTPGAYSRVVYSKGAYVLHMLRMMMYDFGQRDDSRFIAMMQDFAATYGGRDASTEDFQAIVSKHQKLDMSWFFNQWVHGTGIPQISIQYSVAPNEKGAFVQGTISQRGVSNDFVTIMPVRVLFGKSGGVGRIVVQGESAPIKLQLPSMPDSLEFNPLQAVLCDLEVKKM